MSKEELKQMIVGILYDDVLASKYQTLGQYRDAMLKKVIDIDVDYEFKKAQPSSQVILDN